MKKFLCLLLIAVCLLGGTVCAGGEEAYEIFPPAEYSFVAPKLITEYDSETLKYTVEKLAINETRCYLCKVWVQDPYRQISKETAPWGEELELPLTMTQRHPEAALAVNGSGYVSPVFPWIPENYPGTNPDYYYTPLGSLTVTNGEVFRNLEGVPYYGLTLEKEGLQMYVEADNEAVLAREPLQTWSFYIECPLIRVNEDILPEVWDFAERHAMRTVIARTDRNNYLLLTVTKEGRYGLTLRDVNAFLLDNFDRIEWAYDLDGGPSSALIYRKKDAKKFRLLWGGESKDTDILFFRELPAE